jgi:hypothetical protein
VDAYIADPLSGDEMPLTAAYAAGVFGLAVGSATPDAVAQLPDGLPVERHGYPDARHEVVNETNRDEVTDDLIGRLDQRMATR